MFRDAPLWDTKKVNDFDAAVMKSVWDKVKDILDKLTCEACKVSRVVINQDSMHMFPVTHVGKIFCPEFRKRSGDVGLLLYYYIFTPLCHSLHRGGGVWYRGGGYRGCGCLSRGVSGQTSPLGKQTPSCR